MQPTEPGYYWASFVWPWHARETRVPVKVEWSSRNHLMGIPFGETELFEMSRFSDWSARVIDTGPLVHQEGYCDYCGRPMTEAACNAFMWRNIGTSSKT